MSTTPDTRILSVTSHLVEDLDADTTYRAEVLRLAGGSVIGYRVESDDVGDVYSPLETGIAEALTTE